MTSPETDSTLRGTVSLSEVMPVVETTAARVRYFRKQTRRIQEEILEFAKVYLDFLNNHQDEDKERTFLNFWNKLGGSETIRIREMAVSIVLRSQEAMRRKSPKV